MAKHNPIRIDFTLPRDKAMALAQFCKRSSFTDYMTNAIDETEAYKMVSAIGLLQDALARAGFSPR